MFISTKNTVCISLDLMQDYSKFKIYPLNAFPFIFWQKEKEKKVSFSSTQFSNFNYFKTKLFIRPY